MHPWWCFTPRRTPHASSQTFRGSREPWIVAVNMVSEGVDIPRLRVGVYATAAKTPLIFRQIVGRFVRTLPDRAAGGELAVPAGGADTAYARLTGGNRAAPRTAPRGAADTIGRSRPTARQRAVPSSGVRALERRIRRQMTLFGPPQRAPSATSAKQQPQPEPEAAPIAAFERRASLRQERSRLVAELHRRDGRSHREINAWLNRAVGVERVDTASIQQLERSIAALIAELTRDKRRATAR